VCQTSNPSNCGLRHIKGGGCRLRGRKHSKTHLFQAIIERGGPISPVSAAGDAGIGGHYVAASS
jgi:hypothetical protein